MFTFWGHVAGRIETGLGSTLAWLPRELFQPPEPQAVGGGGFLVSYPYYDSDDEIEELLLAGILQRGERGGRVYRTSDQGSLRVRRGDGAEPGPEAHHHPDRWRDVRRGEHRGPPESARAHSPATPHGGGDGWQAPP